MKNPFLLEIVRPALIVLVGLTIAAPGEAQSIVGYLPAQEAPHEGTWLQWPHHHTYGVTYRNRLDATWVEMTRALVPGERVHIIAYDTTERTRITGILASGGVSLSNVDFLLRPNDDCWVRDNGPIFVHGAGGQQKLADWGFNGWGFDTPYLLDDTVPIGVATYLGLPRVDLNATVLEGGSIEVDGNGVLMATRSSILEPNRNPGLTQAQLQNILTTNLGVTKFIWLDGAPGGQLDITDTHIDGFAMFGPSRTIVTMSSASLAYWGLSTGDINTLYNATDIGGAAYTFVQLPLTAANVVTTYGFNIGFKGSYVNYYVGNTVVLVPTYNDANDNQAINILQQLYPNRTVVGIDVRNLYRDGGMVHCVTQQQPEPLPLDATSFCAGDGTVAACPCTNGGAAGNGCNNSAVTGGARLGAAGTTNPDTVVFTATGELPTALTILLQGSTPIAPIGFGDGLRCFGGTLKRLYSKSAVGGQVSAPTGAEPTVTARSAALGDSISPGSTRYYMTYYRDPSSFCTAATFNGSQGLEITW